MYKIRNSLLRLIGVIGTAGCLAIFIHEPSFPTPDKLFVFLVFVFMIFNQTWEFIKRFVPFVVIILVYESFRSVADNLNKNVHYTFAPHIDKLLFGNLPTIYLQNWWWSGHMRWYDIVLYIPYMLFFIVPLFLAILIWKTHDHFYWQGVTAYSLLFFSAFLTFLILPTAPPWLAAQHGYIPHITRISSYVWNSLGIHNFPSLYNHLSPNPVAAFPSLHSGVSTLFAIIIFSLYGWRWGLVSLIYPVLIYIGVIYEGEHYATDVVAGITYAFAAHWAAPKVLAWLSELADKFKAFSNSTRTASKSAQ